MWRLMVYGWGRLNCNTYNISIVNLGPGDYRPGVEAAPEEKPILHFEYGISFCLCCERGFAVPLFSPVRKLNRFSPRLGV